MDKMKKMLEKINFNCEICSERTKMPKEENDIKHFESYYPKERYQQIRCIYQIN